MKGFSAAASRGNEISVDFVSYLDDSFTTIVYTPLSLEDGLPFKLFSAFMKK